MEGEKPENSVNIETGALLRATSIEGPSLPITGHELNGQNFIEWARSVRIFLQGKGKEGYITGDSKEPEKGDSNLLQKLLQQTMLDTGKNIGVNETAPAAPMDIITPTAPLAPLGPAPTIPGAPE
ncbi:Gag-polypeptide of LTR copia-type [Sesbania bispinosa]|nr:Gag-polypeptide of LTR copia-type [Sesbania bispinosa]